LTICTQKYINIGIHQLVFSDSNLVFAEKHEASSKIECIKWSDLATSLKWLAQETALSGRN